MPAGYEREVLDNLKQTAGIIPFSSRLKQWSAVGGEYRGICVFHSDHNPSCSVYQDKSSKEWRFKCFSGSCGAAGDVFKLVQQTDGVDFPSAIQKVALEVGFSLPDNDRVEAFSAAEFRYDWRQGTNRLLQSDHARQYLASRAIGSKSIVAHKVGLTDHPRLGMALVIPYRIDEPSGKVTAKLRALGDDVLADCKWSHFPDAPTATLLFNEKALDSFEQGNAPVFVVESELDCLMMEELGYRTVSVSSASACVKNVNGNDTVTIEPTLIEKLRDAHQIFIATDMDDAGEKCARLLTKAIERPTKTFRIRWDYVKGGEQPKDIGDLAKQFRGDGEAFKAKIAELSEEAKIPILWRQAPTLAKIAHKEQSWLVPDCFAET